MKEELARKFVEFLYGVAALDGRVVFLIILLVMAVIVLDAVFHNSKKKYKESGLGKSPDVVSIDGSKTLQVRNYVSEIQGLAGKPDAIIVENGFIIPVERKPLARKIRDRYVAQLLVYMRLVEEFEGKKPPYGYLILGPNCRKFKIDNSEERQQWLQKMLDEMREVLVGKPATATPEIRKCQKCYVKESCQSRLEHGPQTIRPKSSRPLRVIEERRS
jgi:CRISPR/Cas system-associated exonuclease Cas4 (RecB family)